MVSIITENDKHVEKEFEANTINLSVNEIMLKEISKYPTLSVFDNSFNNNEH
jgi:hypothetical protein